MCRRSMCRPSPTFGTFLLGNCSSSVCVWRDRCIDYQYQIVRQLNDTMRNFRTTATSELSPGRQTILGERASSLYPKAKDEEKERRVK